MGRVTSKELEKFYRNVDELCAEIFDASEPAVKETDEKSESEQSA